jgi:hypothetical protein
LILIGLVLIFWWWADLGFASYQTNSTINITKVEILDENGNPVASATPREGAIVPLDVLSGQVLAPGKTYMVCGTFEVNVKVVTNDTGFATSTVTLSYSGDWEEATVDGAIIKTTSGSKTVNVNTNVFTKVLTVVARRRFYVTAGSSGTTSVKLSVTATFTTPKGSIMKSDSKTCSVEWKAGTSYSYDAYVSTGTNVNLVPLGIVGDFVSFATSDPRLTVGVILVLLGLMLEVSRRW